MARLVADLVFEFHDGKGGRLSHLLTRLSDSRNNERILLRNPLSAIISTVWDIQGISRSALAEDFLRIHRYKLLLLVWRVLANAFSD